MKSNFQFVFFSSTQNLERHRIVKVALFAEYVAIVCQLLFSNLWNHFFTNQVHIIILFILELRRECMSTQESWNDFNLLTVFFSQSINNFQKQNFSRKVEAISRLHLKSSSSICNESFDISLIGLENLLKSCRSTSLNR